MGKVAGLISTNYSSEEYGKLIEPRPIAGIPFGGRYRLIDIPLSCMVNSGINTVGVITPSDYRSLADHLNMGREWGLNTKRGGMYMLPGASHGLKQFTSKFSMRDMIRNVEFFQRSSEDTVLICAANRVYNMDFRPFIKAHSESGCQVSLLYKSEQNRSKQQGTYLDIDEETARVSGIGESLPEGEAKVFLDIVLIERKLLMDFIEAYHNLDHIDLIEVLASNLDVVKVNAFMHEGYEHAIDSATDYMRVSMDLLRPAVQKELFVSDMPILTKTQDSPPAKYLANAKVSNSLVAAGCTIAGTVENSILFRGVEVQEGAVVRNSIVMQHGSIAAGASLENVVCDKYVSISPDASISASPTAPIVIERGAQL